MHLPRFLRRLVVTAITAACLTPAASLAARAQAATDNASDSAVGVQFHGMWSSYTDAQRQQILDELKGAGVQWVRLDLGWAMLQPNGPGSYDMGWGVPFADRVINMIHAEGMHILVTFWLTPSWANGGAGETALPTNPADYANALKWAAARYAGKVDAWEIWNEPNMSYSMAGADPVSYAALLRAAYPAAHAGDPNTKVVFGGPSENDVPWIQKAYAAGIKGSFDVMATHPYMGPSNDPPSTPDDGSIYKLAHVTAVHDLMTANGDGDKPIWFTEFGWSSHANTSGMENWELGVTPDQQGQYLVQTLQLMKQKYPYVTNAFWYEANDENTGTTQNNDNYGLLDSSLRPKPAYTALEDYLATASTGSTTDTSTTGTATPTTDPGTSTGSTGSTSTTGTTTPAPATLNVQAPLKRPYRSLVQVSAQLTSGATGAPLTGAPVSISVQDGSTGWHSLSTLTTNSSGNVAVSVRPTRSIDVRFSYVEGGQLAAVATRHVTVSSVVSARPTAWRVRHGNLLELRGHVAPGQAGLLVQRQLYYSGHWHVVGSTRTTAGGAFRFVVRTNRAGRLHYRVVVTAQSGRAAAATSAIGVRVV